MKEGYRKNISIAAWISVLFLQLQVVRPEDDITYLRASSGDIKSRFYPQDYPKNYFHDWQIKAPTGYRIRLKFRTFDLGNCNNGDLLEVWQGQRIVQLCGQQIPPTIESSGNEMELYFNSYGNSRGGKFWAHYEIFDENEAKTTQSRIYTTLTPDLNTGDGESNNGISESQQRLYLLIGMMACVFFLIIVTIFCGCRKKRRRHRSQRPTPTNVANDPELENEGGILELNFGDPPPSYDEVTRPSVQDISSITQEPSGESTSTDEGIDSSGLPSYREALRLSQQTLDQI